MRTLKKNKQRMWYALPKLRYVTSSDGQIFVTDQRKKIIYDSGSQYPPTEDIFERDENGNVIYTYVDGTAYPVIAETKQYFDSPVLFYANISFDSGQTTQAEYGLDTSGYEAVISADKGALPFSEQTLIWHTSVPEVDEIGRAFPDSADYRVVAIKTSLNEERFFLKKRVDD